MSPHSLHALDKDLKKHNWTKKANLKALPPAHRAESTGGRKERKGQKHDQFIVLVSIIRQVSVLIAHSKLLLLIQVRVDC